MLKSKKNWHGLLTIMYYDCLLVTNAYAGYHYIYYRIDQITLLFTPYQLIFLVLTCALSENITIEVAYDQTAISAARCPQIRASASIAMMCGRDSLVPGEGGSTPMLEPRAYQIHTAVFAMLAQVKTPRGQHTIPSRHRGHRLSTQTL